MNIHVRELVQNFRINPFLKTGANSSSTMALSLPDKFVKAISVSKIGALAALFNTARSKLWSCS